MYYSTNLYVYLFLHQSIIYLSIIHLFIVDQMDYREPVTGVMSAQIRKTTTINFIIAVNLLFNSFLVVSRYFHLIVINLIMAVKPNSFVIQKLFISYFTYIKEKTSTHTHTYFHLLRLVQNQHKIKQFPCIESLLEMIF